MTPHLALHNNLLIIALLTILTHLPLPTTAIHFDVVSCIDRTAYRLNPTAADCRHIASRLPTNQSSQTHLPSHYLTPPSPFHPGGYFRYGSCLIVTELLQEHLTSYYGERYPSTSPALREEDAFAIWGALRIAIEEVVHECIDVSSKSGGDVTFDAWGEFDGQVQMFVYGDEGGVADEAPNLRFDVPKDASMLNLYEFDETTHASSVPEWYEWDA